MTGKVGECLSEQELSELINTKALVHKKDQAK